MTKEIHLKLSGMTKLQLERVCRKIKCSKGTKKQMILNLLRPFTKKKYGMDSDEDDDDDEYTGSEYESDYIYSDTDDDTHYNDTSESNKETTIPDTFVEQLNELVFLSAQSGIYKNQEFKLPELKKFLIQIRLMNSFIMENAYKRLREYIRQWKKTGGHTGSQIENIIGIAVDEYKENEKNIKKIREIEKEEEEKRKEKRKEEEERRIKPTSREARRELFSKRFLDK
jgi:hypothetical protein